METSNQNVSRNGKRVSLPLTNHKRTLNDGILGLIEGYSVITKCEGCHIMNATNYKLVVSTPILVHLQFFVLGQAASLHPTIIPILSMTTAYNLLKKTIFFKCFTMFPC